MDGNGLGTQSETPEPGHTRSAGLPAKLDLGPVVRILRQREDDKRAGMTMATSDVRAMVDAIAKLDEALAWAQTQAHLAHMALLDHDWRLADEFARNILHMKMEPAPK